MSDISISLTLVLLNAEACLSFSFCWCLYRVTDIFVHLSDYLVHHVEVVAHLQSISQSFHKFISRHSTEACAIVRLCQIKEK